MTPRFHPPLSDLREVLQDPSYPLYEIRYQPDDAEEAAAFKTKCPPDPNDTSSMRFFYQLTCIARAQGNVYTYKRSWESSVTSEYVIGVMADSDKGILPAIGISQVIEIRNRVLKENLTDISEMFYFLNGPMTFEGTSAGPLHVRNNRKLEPLFQALSWMFDYGASMGTNNRIKNVSKYFCCSIYTSQCYSLKYLAPKIGWGCLICRLLLTLEKKLLSRTSFCHLFFGVQ